MAVALTILDIDEGQSTTYVFGVATFSGSYATGGDTLDFTTIAGKESGGQVFIAASAPSTVGVWGSSGHSYGYVKGSPATMANGKVKINTAAGTELTAGAYPAAITGDVNIYFEATFAKFL